jgi:predicted transcriptional regulator
MGRRAAAQSLRALLLVAMVRHAATRPENLAAYPMRARILEAVRQEPGIRVTRLRRSLGCSAGTVQHHLNLLQKAGLIEFLATRRRTCVFPADSPSDTRPEVTLARSGRTRQMLQSILRRPGIIQRDLMSELSMSRRVMRNYLNQLSEKRLLEEVPRGRYRTYYPSSHLFELIGTLQLGPAAETPAAPAAGFQPAGPDVAAPPPPGQ